MPRKKKIEGAHETNAEFVARVLDTPKSGPLMQVFVIEAMRRYAELCASGDLSKMDTGPISAAHWKRCAVELKEEIDKHLGE